MPARPLPKNVRMSRVRPPNLKIPERDGGDSPEAPEAERPEPPSPPEWLPDAAKAEYLRVGGWMQADRSWKPKFSNILVQYAVLQAEFVRDPLSLPATKLNTLRLLQNDLGLSPGSSHTVLRR